MTQIQTAKLSDSLRNIAASAEMEGVIFRPLFKKCACPFWRGNALHQFLFGELYDWAGSVRNIDISKQRTRFCPAAEIPALLDIVLRIQDRKHKSALNLFCHLSEAVEVQGILLFQELDCDVAVSSNVRLGQVFRPLQKSVISVIQEHDVVGQRKLLVPDLTLKWVGVVRFLGVFQNLLGPVFVGIASGLCAGLPARASLPGGTPGSWDA